MEFIKGFYYITYVKNYQTVHYGAYADEETALRVFSMLEKRGLIK